MSIISGLLHKATIELREYLLDYRRYADYIAPPPDTTPRIPCHKSAIMIYYAKSKSASKLARNGRASRQATSILKCQPALIYYLSIAYVRIGDRYIRTLLAFFYDYIRSSLYHYLCRILLFAKSRRYYIFSYLKG